MHTENSYKYSIERFAALAQGAGLAGARELDGRREDVLGARAGGCGVGAGSSTRLSPFRRRPQRHRLPHRHDDHDHGGRNRQPDWRQIRQRTTTAPAAG
ncbi:hypothetical protein ACU4GH_01050 [Bradyrhizobium betae]